VSDPLEHLRAKSKQTRERILQVVTDLSDAQLGWRPAPSAHSIGFTLWHTARADDNVQSDLSGRELEWVSGGYAKRWSHPERGVGTGWDDERAATLPLPSKTELLAYAARVFGAVDAALDGVDDTRWAETLKSRFMGADSTLGEVVLVCMTHENRHLGEMEYIKGLQGLRGSVTI
jgi:uncharacterized damage-inducible protein DinB